MNGPHSLNETKQAMKFLVKLGLILYNKDKQNVSLGGIFIMDLYTYLNQYHQIVLTDDQLAATQALDGPICVISCPGSGKTTVTVIRLANLILSGKVHPQQILALTFSKASARDMNERFQALFPKLSKQVQFSTIHSFAFQLIKHYQQLSGVMYQFIEGNQTTLHKKQLLTQFYIETTERYPSDDDLETLTGQISLLKNLMIEPHHTKEIKQYVETEVEEFIQLYKKYEAFKESRYLLDYDDLLTTAFSILKHHDYLLNFYQTRYTHIQIDEAQDTSKIQYELIKLIASRHHNIFLVGDDDQSIYAFRGAYPKQLLTFKETFKEARILYMNQNFRSTASIVSTSSQFIQHNKSRYKKTIQTQNETGMSPTLHHFQTEQEQLSFLITTLKQAEDLNDVAILYRQNVSALPLIEQFERHQIPFKLQEGKLSFFYHPIVRDIKAIITLSRSPNHLESFQRVAKILYLSATTQHQVTSQTESGYLDYLTRLVTFNSTYQREKVRLFKQNLMKLPSLPCNRMMAFILNTLDYESYLIKKGFLKDEKEERLYTQGMAVLETLKMIAKDVDSHKAFLERLEHLRLISEQSTTQAKGVNLLTFHASKGLEFKTVFLIDCMNGITPPQTAIIEAKSQIFDHYEEERRLFYVAMTRAKEQLTLLSVAKKHNLLFSRSNFYKEVSKILNPIDEEPKPVSSRLSHGKKIEELKRGLITSESADLTPFKEGSVINHKRFGTGTIIEKEGEIVTIQFENETKRISLRITVLNGNVELVSS